MIEMPHRSITRFFVPMIDVLTLLFCIYLLMPIVQDPNTGESDSSRSERLAKDAEAKPETDEAVLARMREEIEKLKKERMETLKQRLTVRVLEVDGKTGVLSFRDTNLEPVPVLSENDARKLIERDRELHGGVRELYYLVLCPRDRTSEHPNREERIAHRSWFDGVALGYDEPGVIQRRKP